MKKLTLEFIKQKTKEIAEGYSCNAEKYINSYTKLEFRCNKGHTFVKIWNNFQRGQRCPECNKLYKDKWKSQRLSYNYVKTVIKKYKYKLLSEDYINSKEKLKIKCDKNHIFYMAYNTLQQGHKCGICYKNKKKEDHPRWKGGVTKKNIPLFDTYAYQISWIEKVRRDPENTNYLQVKCTNSDCKKWFTPKYTDVVSRIGVLNGKSTGAYRFYCSNKCKQSCSIFGKQKYPEGFKNLNNNRPDQKEWANMVKERDKYICQKCGKQGTIAHHIEGLNINPLMSADISIGITLCKECDKKIHSEIGCRPIDLTKNKICEGRF